MGMLPRRGGPCSIERDPAATEAWAAHNGQSVSVASTVAIRDRVRV